jgi:outer membrane murein-binding lipoprotein Lpp
MPGFDDKETFSEIRYRLREPSEFTEKCRRKDWGDGISAVLCELKGVGGWKNQALRFKKKKPADGSPWWTVEKARAWVESHRDRLNAEAAAEPYTPAAVEVAQLSALYTKPVLNATGPFPHPQDPKRHIQFTPETLSAVAAETTRFLNAGGRVPVVLGHPKKGEDPLEDPANYELNRGWVTAVWVEDGKLVGQLEITNQKTAERIDEGSLVAVSPGIVSGFRNSAGEFGPLMNHVALTLKEFMAGQAGFSKLEAPPFEIPRSAFKEYLGVTFDLGDRSTLAYFEAGEPQAEPEKTKLGGLLLKLEGIIKALGVVLKNPEALLEGIEFKTIKSPSAGEVFTAEDGQKFTRDCYLITESPDDPSTWQGRVAEYVRGELRITKEQLAKAAAFLRGDLKDSVTVGQKAAAAKKLAGLFRELGAEPPASLETVEAEMNELDELKAKVGQLEQDLEGVKKERDDLKAAQEAAAEATLERRKAAFSKRTDALVKDGKMTPVDRVRSLATFNRLADQEEIVLEVDGKSEKQSVEDFVLGPFEESGSFFNRNVKADPTKKELDLPSLDVTDPDALHKAVRLLMESEKIEKYADARKVLLERKRALDFEAERAAARDSGKGQPAGGSD